MSSRLDRSSAYWVEYWKKNRDRINESRRNRYRSDDEYRSKIKESRVRIENHDFDVPDFDYSKAIEFRCFGSKVIPLFSIPYVASFVDRSVPTVKSWINKRYLPESPFRAENRMWLFSDEMIISVYSAIGRQGFLRHLDMDKFKVDILSDWQAKGYLTM